VVSWVCGFACAAQLGFLMWTTSGALSVGDRLSAALPTRIVRRATTPIDFFPPLNTEIPCGRRFAGLNTGVLGLFSQSLLPFCLPGLNILIYAFCRGRLWSRCRSIFCGCGGGGITSLCFYRSPLERGWVFRLRDLCSCGPDTHPPKPSFRPQNAEKMLGALFPALAVSVVKTWFLWMTSQPLGQPSLRRRGF